MRVEVSLLGGFVVVVDGRAVDPERWGGERGRALVKLLALSRGHRLHREQVIDALWPELSLRAAAPRLHKATHMARRALGDQAAVVTSEGALALWPSAELVVDVDRFESLAIDARNVSGEVALAEALEVYRGDLLPDDLYSRGPTRLDNGCASAIGSCCGWRVGGTPCWRSTPRMKPRTWRLPNWLWRPAIALVRCAVWTSWTGCSTRSSACRRATPPFASGQLPRQCRSRCRCRIGDRRGSATGCRHRSRRSSGVRPSLLNFAPR